MMRKTLILGITFMLFLACSEKKHDNPVSALALDHNSVRMKAGDSWLYKRMFINLGISASMGGVPDTLIGYSYFQAVKDTVIDLRSYLIVEGRDYEVDKDTVTIFKKRSAIHFSDTAISMYEFNTGEFGFLSGVLKTAMPGCRLTKNNYGTTILKRLEMQKLAAIAGYDSTVFCDFVYPILFPLIKDSIYTYRTIDSNGNGRYRRKFLGIESITVPVGTHEAYKFEWLVKEALGIDSVYGFDWVGVNGLLKRYWDIGNISMRDSLGMQIGTFRCFDIFERIGNTDINPDTLVPWGKR